MFCRAIRTFLVFTALLVVSLVAAGPLAAQKTDVNRLIETGSQKYHAGDMDGAIADYRQAAVLQPGDPSILFNLAQALGDQGSLAESEQTYLKLFPIYDQLQVALRDQASAIN
jgi:Flp pilus assembly protein TadD